MKGCRHCRLWAGRTATTSSSAIVGIFGDAAHARQFAKELVDLGVDVILACKLAKRAAHTGTVSEHAFGKIGQNFRGNSNGFQSWRIPWLNLTTPARQSGLSGLCPRDKNTRDISETYHERGSSAAPRSYSMAPSFVYSRVATIAA